jgi:hypothetical protein
MLFFCGDVGSERGVVGVHGVCYTEEFVSVG